MINTGNLKLHALLAVMAAMLEGARRQSDEVRELMRQDFVFQFETENGGGGYLSFRGGRVGLRYGRHAAPDFRQVWQDGHVAVAALTAGREEAIFQAIQDGICRMEGTFPIAIRFNELMKHAGNPPLARKLRDVDAWPAPARRAWFLLRERASFSLQSAQRLRQSFQWCSRS